MQNGDEGWIDCGGSCGGVCTTCSDGVHNGDETSADCGGSCVPCTCFDGVHNDDEDGVDCGANCANACTLAQHPCYTDSVDNPSDEEVLCNSKGLVGTIPAEVGELTQLTELHIWQNYELTGPIPAAIGDLTLRGSR